MLKAPFPWFGGKRRISHEVWPRLGEVHNYVEPFAGSLAVLLARPDWPFETNKIETVNDIDCYLSNAWRSMSMDPDEVAKWADGPVNEADLHARHRWLYDNKDFRRRMRTEPEYHDCKVAGWWMWGLSSWIGANWCSNKGLLEDNVKDARSGPIPRLGDSGVGVNRALGPGNTGRSPHLGDSGQGVNRALKQAVPHLGDSGQGVNRALKQQKPSLSNSGLGVNRELNQQKPSLGGTRCVERVMNGRNRTCEERLEDLRAYMRDLRDRLRFVRVCCGDWKRVCTPSVAQRHGLTGVFLDPPYSMENREQQDVYSINSNDGSMTAEIMSFCMANQDDPDMRIALCGLEGEYNLPGWQVMPWTGNIGMAKEKKGNVNRHMERIWFSPHCLKEGDLEVAKDSPRESMEPDLVGPRSMDWD